MEMLDCDGDIPDELYFTIFAYNMLNTMSGKLEEINQIESLRSDL